MGLGVFNNNNVTIKNNGGYLNAAQGVQFSNVTQVIITGPNPAGEQTVLNGTITVVTNPSGLPVLEYTFDGGSTWYDIVSIAGAGTLYTFNNFVLGGGCGFRINRSGGIGSSTFNCRIMYSKTINTP